MSGGGSCHAARRAAAVEIDFAEAALRRYRALLGRSLEPFHGVDEVLRHAATGLVEAAEQELGLRLTGGCARAQRRQGGRDIAVREIRHLR